MSDRDLLDLVYLAQQNDQEAMSQILDYFKPLIRKVCNKSNPQDRSDLEQIINEKVIQAVQTYDLRSVPGFTSFCESICRNTKL